MRHTDAGLRRARARLAELASLEAGLTAYCFHELMRTLEAKSIRPPASLLTEAALQRTESRSGAAHRRLDYPETDDLHWRRRIDLVKAMTHNPIQVDLETCIHCMICDYVCPGDVIHQQPRASTLPTIAYPDECWYCGLREQACPADAITVVFPEEMLHPTTPVTALLGRP